MKLRWNFVLYALLTLFALSCAPGPTPPPGHAPEFAYVGRDGRIYALNLESGAVRVMSGEGNFADPLWSPDGEHLAFVRGGDPWAEGNEIWVVNADGSGPRKLADGYAPEWTPEGRLLFISNFQMREEGAAQSISLVDMESGSEEEIISQLWQGGFWPLEEARYSADGEWLAVYASGLEAEGRLFVLPAAGGEPVEVAQFVYDVANYDWSPQDHLLAFRDSGEPFRGDEVPSLVIYDVIVQNRSVSLDEGYFWPRWSPDGKGIALFQIQDGGDFRVTILEVDESGLAPIISEPPVLGTIYPEVFANIWGADPSWSPGQGILFNALFDADTGEIGVYVMDPATGQITLLTKEENPQARWSPDGAWIAVAIGEPGSREIYVVQADGQGLEKVADGTGPAWRP